MYYLRILLRVASLRMSVELIQEIINVGDSVDCGLHCSGVKIKLDLHRFELKHFLARKFKK